jgi:hypothetical protein
MVVAVATALSLGVFTGTHLSATATAGPASTGHEAGGAGPPAAAPAAAGSFRSVRSLPDVALPVRLRIPVVGIDAPVQPLGRNPDRTIQVPTDFGAAGWFAEGARPGQEGPAVILGHVDSTTGPAAFYRLGDLTPGTEVAVDRADGSTVRFRITDVQRTPKTAFPTDLVYGASLAPSLRLVTCGGSFDQTRRSYRDNVIAFAEPTP